MPPRIHTEPPLAAGTTVALPPGASRHVQVLRLQPGAELTLFDGQANERMDTVVEKATELGAAAVQPLVCERSVLRLAGERAERKAAHWQGVAVAACEQSGRNRVPLIHQPQPLGTWLAALPPTQAGELRLVLSLAEGTRPLRSLLAASPPVTSLCVLSGPEGGLSPAELAAAAAAGFQPTTLGPRVLRADTAPLAVLASVATLETPA
ncbi:MAG: 16S rRNA (uracil(1498)-N(3))-methyltransferase [Burkholderiales bacterium PBB5]|nr:MAG: 16S rRNA (uracil(1498)-N(3))-methyltransferase [Burkholderiales bacterium PBB5]